MPKRKQQTDGEAIQEAAPVTSKKKRVSFVLDDNRDDSRDPAVDATLTNRRSKKKKGKRKKNKTAAVMSPLSSTPVSKRDDALRYLHQWSTDQTNWSFKKRQQLWLVQNMYNKTQVHHFTCYYKNNRFWLIDQLLVFNVIIHVQNIDFRETHVNTKCCTRLVTIVLLQVDRTSFKQLLLYLEELKGAQRSRLVEQAMQMVEQYSPQQEPEEQDITQTPAANKVLRYQYKRAVELLRVLA